MRYRPCFWVRHQQDRWSRRELAPWLAQWVEDHVQQCPTCRRAWEDERLLTQALRTLPTPAESASARERVLARLATTTPPVCPARSRRVLILVSAAVIGSLGLGANWRQLRLFSQRSGVVLPQNQEMALLIDLHERLERDYPVGESRP